MTTVKYILAIVIVLLLVALILLFLGKAEAAPVGYHWGPPKATVDGFLINPDYMQYYDVFIVLPDTFAYHSSVTDTTCVIEVPLGHTISIAVAAVDTFGQQGPKSEASDPYFVNPGAPGSPTQPQKYE